MFGGGMAAMGGISGIGLGSMAGMGGMGLGGFGEVFGGTSAPMAGIGASSGGVYGAMGAPPGDSWPLWILLYLHQLMIPMKKKQTNRDDFKNVDE
jgi:hypothetical protein